MWSLRGFVARLFVIAVCLFLAGCSPQVQLRTDDIALPTRSWLPKHPKAIIVALHGFNDYSNAFESAGAYFRERGVAVYAYDQRGFGAAPNRGIWAGEENLTADLAQFVAQVKARHPRRPVFVLGESMGGAVAVSALAQPDFPEVQGVVLVAPALWGRDTMPLAFHASSWLLAHTLPFYKMTGEDLRIRASDNIPMLRALGRDPLIIKGTRADAIYGLVGLMGNASGKVPAVSVPVLLLYGAHDEVIPPEPVESARTRFTAPVTYIHYPEGYHMLLRDLQGEKVMGDIKGWIDHPIDFNQ